MSPSFQQRPSRAAPFRQWSRHPVAAELVPRYEAWRETVVGRAVLSQEQQMLEAALSTCFGYHLLQLSMDRSLCLHDSARIQGKFCCHPDLSSQSVGAQCDFDQLPFASDSIDTIILHHVHEFAENPHLVLREAERVLIPQGRIIVVGFNPVSLLGAFSMLARFSEQSLWHQHLLTARRVSDWLALLGCKVESVEHAFHRPPLSRLCSNFTASAAPHFTRWPFGAIYMISAIKQVSILTPSRMRWRRARSFNGLAAAKPTAGNAANKTRKVA